MAEILLKSTSNIPYLDQDAMANFTDMKIMSESGTVFKFNSLLLMSWNRIGGIFLMDSSGNLQNPLIEVLKSHYELGKDVFISSNFSDLELIMLRNFVMFGKVPNGFNHDDLPLEMVKLLMCFGIDLKYVCQIRKEQPNSDKNIGEQSKKNQNQVESALNEEVDEDNMDVIDVDFEHNIMYEPKENVVQENSSEEAHVNVDKVLPNNDENEVEENQVIDVKDEIDHQVETTENAMPVESNKDHNIGQEKNLPEGELNDEIENDFVNLVQKKLQKFTKDDAYQCQSCQKTWVKKDQYDFHMKWKLCQKPILSQSGSPSKKRKLSSTTFVNILQKAPEENDIIEQPPQTHPKVYHSSSSFLDSKFREMSIFICATCGVMFDSEEKLLNHQEAHKVVKITHPFQCEFCDKKFTKEHHLMNHTQAVHKEKPCDKCDKAFGTKRELTTHKQYYHDEAPKPRDEKCPECDKSYATIEALDQHFARIHEPSTNTMSRDYECETCGKTYAKMKHLENHQYREHSKSPCAECGLMFPVSYLKRHIMAVHTEDSKKDWPCKTCPKAYATKERLESHMLIHTGERPYICQYCGDTFNDLSNQRAHERSVHLGIKRKPKIKPATQTDEFGNNTPKKPKGRPKKQSDNASVEN